MIDIIGMLSTIVLLILSFITSGTIYFLIFYLNDLWGKNFYIYLWAPVVATPIVYLLYFLLFVIILFVTGLFVNIDKNRKKNNALCQYVVQFVTHQINFFGGVRIKKSGFDKLPKKGPLMIIYNHKSNFDPMMIMDVMHKYKIICITKKDNKRIPIAGPWVHLAGYISINREDNVEALKDIVLAINFVKKYNQSICVSPEGTRNKTDDLLLAFHPGTFKIATKTQIPIVELGIKNTPSIHKNFPKRRTKVNLDVIRVITYEEYKDLNTVEISEMCHKDYENYLSK